MPRKSLVLLTVCLATVTINLSTTITNIALPTLAEELDAGTRELLWIVDGYNLAFAALVLAMGSLSDRFGRRPALVLGLAGFALSSAAAALVDTSAALVAIRVAMGVFAAVIFPTTLSIIANAFTERRARASALGLWGASVGVGVALGPVAGGFLLEHYSWHSVFLALVPISVLTIAMALAWVPESRDPHVPRIDRPGFVVSVAALGTLTWTIIEAPEHGWSSAITIAGFAAAAALVIGFVLIERAVAHPMIDVTLFLDRRFSAACGAVTIAFFALFGFIFLITQFFQFVRDYTPLETGVRFLPVALSIAVASIVGSWLAPRVGTKAVVTPGLVMLGGAFLWVATIEVDVAYASVVVPQMVLLGGGIGLVSTPATESIMRVLPPARAGVGSAVNDATRELGGTLGVAVVGSIFSFRYADSLLATVQGRLDGPTADAAADSVGFADAVAAQVPGLAAAVDDAFLDGLALGCTVIGVLCLVGGLAALVALPGNHDDSPDQLDQLDQLDDRSTAGDVVGTAHDAPRR
ncbi:DHA2 family efflux MFS transporter permease subunit [Nocardioides sp. zg-579]|uniref:DHA2 family efflux MFS transporter permease subunit n=1 Tax=Nocardioides marmotae TaxID=2663857 RepID=A0A6I3JAY0_9ACTN|nr:MFS transporter [Nocardioides marmotae]MCR6031635.1 DHA2 family efflux MFS transporter permease subunit [Gordonia jinghuaiqii]MTB95274.1 DHA2 family efflux MFS transporter permease subunit [Nocardioides marmotae]QKE02257.1 MFS transporter [Nocardioides marmotae]